MTTIHDVCDRWVQRVTGETDKSPLSIRRVFPDRRGDRIFSYGHHFEMGRALRDKRGNVTHFLLNGDRYSPSTTNHQNKVRSAVDRSGVPRVIIPYSALESSGIDLDSIQIIDATPDAWVPVERTSLARPFRSFQVNGDGDLRIWSGRGQVPVHVEQRADGTTRYRWTDRVHRLGESLIRARVRLPGFRWRTAKFLSGFDTQELTPLYFLCELPRTRAATVADAYDALKPDVVKIAEQMNRAVSRQGDIFAVGLSPRTTKRGLRKAGATFESSGQLLGTNHVATEVARMPDGTTLTRGLLRHVPEGRRRDHANVRLTHGWHVAVKNTVPVTV